MIFSSSFGGAERLTYDLAYSLAAMGHEVLLIINRKIILPENVQPEGLSIVRLRILSRRDPIAKYRIHQLFVGFSPHIVHLHLRRAFSLAYSAGRMVGAKVVTSLHNRGRVSVYSKADLILTPTEDLLVFAKTLCLEEHTVHQVPNFSRITTNKIENHVNTSPRFFSYGRFVEKKGFAILIKAWLTLKERGYHLPLSIAGDGPLKQELQALIIQYQLEDLVQLVPWVDDVVKFIDSFDVFVLPSLDEPFGLTVIEAMARGKVVVASKTSGPNSVLNDEFSERFKPGDPNDLVSAICRLLNRGVHIDMAHIAQEKFQSTYSADAVVPLIERHYKKLLNLEEQDEHQSQ